MTESRLISTPCLDFNLNPFLIGDSAICPRCGDEYFQTACAAHDEQLSLFYNYIPGIEKERPVIGECYSCGLKIIIDDFRDIKETFYSDKNNLTLPLEKKFMFFTNSIGYGQWKYPLVTYKDYLKLRKRNYTITINGKKVPMEYDVMIIDPGVNGLKNRKDYPFKDQYPPKKLRANQFFVPLDYPYDVGPDLTQEECIKKTWENIKKWHKHPKAICSVQYEFENLDSLKKNYLKLYPLVDKIGIGNLCKSKKWKNFLIPAVKFIFTHNPNKKWIHFFGLRIEACKFIADLNPQQFFPVSVDSLKFDYGMHNEKRKVGTPGNTKKERWKRFFEYVNYIEKRNVEKSKCYQTHQFLELYPILKNAHSFKSFFLKPVRYKPKMQRLRKIIKDHINSASDSSFKMKFTTNKCLFDFFR
ncbi:MAG: hypothetical protein EAX96_06445 [Candidatus Lokiarchaeota archaeon]|nr:hypothetical protein [Candidatus Lokiarchaeota archaeon]